MGKLMCGVFDLVVICEIVDPAEVVCVQPDPVKEGFGQAAFVVVAFRGLTGKRRNSGLIRFDLAGNWRAGDSAKKVFEIPGRRKNAASSRLKECTRRYGNTGCNRVFVQQEAGNDPSERRARDPIAGRISPAQMPTVRDRAVPPRSRKLGVCLGRIEMGSVISSGNPRAGTYCQIRRRVSIPVADGRSGDGCP